MPRLAGAWLAGAQDSDRAASRAAQDALKQVFPTPEKLQNVGKAFQQPILEYCRDGILNESVQTLSDERTVSPDDADATYARVIATSLAVIANLLSELAQEETTKQQETYDSILGEGRIWEFASYKEVTVRRAAHRLLRTCLAKKRGEPICKMMRRHDIDFLQIRLRGTWTRSAPLSSPKLYIPTRQAPLTILCKP